MRIPMISTLLTFSLLTAAGASHPAVGQGIVAQPVAAWSFDEGSGADVAPSSGRLHGTLRGGASWANGLVGAHALTLSGRTGSFVDVAEPVIDTTRSYTVTACVKLNRASGYQTVVSIDGAQISGFFLQFRDDTDEFAITVPPADSTTGDAAEASSQVAPETGVWYHLAGVYNVDAHSLTLYVNGVEQQTVPCRNPWRATGHTAIGRGKYGGNPVDFVNGAVDDVRLYASSLPAAEVKAIAMADLKNTGVQTSDPSAPVLLKIDNAHPGPKFSPMFYGLMTEEINYSYDGGLYGELIRNRAFKDDPTWPVHWSQVNAGSSAGSIGLDPGQPLNANLPVSLKVTAPGGARVGAANDGFWGIPVRPNTRYQASFYAKAGDGFTGPLDVAIESADGGKTYARAQVKKVAGDWKQYTVMLTTGPGSEAQDTRFVVSTTGKGTFWLDLVSLFPPTYHNRAHGNRIDLMQKLADMKPAFLRMPGGNYLEGDTIATRFDWKKTLGPLTDRPGHPGPWQYRSSDGMGLLEFLTWCEDLHMAPLLAVYAGYSLKGEYVKPGPDLQPYVQDALDEIEYVTGDTGTKWGAIRAKNGHPAPFPLHYIEIGNEDQFDRSGSYDGRFAQFSDAIKAKYPNLETIATAATKSRVPDVLDEHFYRTARTMARDSHHYDNYDRKGPKIFVGEWASQDIDRPWVQPELKGPTPTLNSALGDAAWMTGMERNSDVVVLEAYAPLLVNVNPGGRQWAVNLIGYDALHSFGSPSYYVQVMFAANHGDTMLPGTLTDGTDLYESITRDTKSGTVYVKLVNTTARPRSVHIDTTGFGSVSPNGTAITLAGSGPKDTNTITDPNKIVPVTSPVTGLGKSFDYKVLPYSVTILKMQTR
jgi:alpha-L-arabinofuranosidase